VDIVIDIETIPDQSEGAIKRISKNIKHPAQMKKQETIDDWHNGAGKYAGEKDKAIQEAYLKTSFNGGYGQIVCICADFEGEEYSFTTTGDDKGLLKEFWSCVYDKTVSTYFIAHNAKFDLPFLFHRSIINNVKPARDFKPHGKHGNSYFCTMEAWAGFNGRISLDELSNILGVGSKTEGMSGDQVWPEYQKGNIQKIAGYCMDDVRLTKAIYERLKY
jgi:predicted PolB exonuclease-like 3'-5' exonuclease